MSAQDTMVHHNCNHKGNSKYCMSCTVLIHQYSYPMTYITLEGGFAAHWVGDLFLDVHCLKKHLVIITIHFKCKVIHLMI